MSDTFTEVTHTGFGQRLASSFGAMIFGALLFFASFAVLAWNESRGVTQIRTLEEGKKVVVNINPAQPSPATNGMLVFASGHAETDEVIEDSTFPISVTALKLRRVVEMYQWDEDKDTETSSGTKRTTYRYDREWSEKLIRSDNFHVSSGHQNPTSMPFQSGEATATEVTVGAYRLSQGLLDQIKDYTTYAPTSEDVDGAPDGPQGAPKLVGTSLYYGPNPSSPQIGDTRVRFELVKPLDVSFVAKQVGESFGPYLTQAGNTIELLETGIHDSNYIFQAALTKNAILTWALRVGGWFMMFLGLLLLTGPITMIAGYIPFLGGLVGLGVGLLSFVLASVLSTITVAIAWLVVRPLAGAALLVVAGACLWAMKNRGQKKLDARVAVPPPPPPPSAATTV